MVSIKVQAGPLWSDTLVAPRGDQFSAGLDLAPGIRQDERAPIGVEDLVRFGVVEIPTRQLSSFPGLPLYSRSIPDRHLPFRPVFPARSQGQSNLTFQNQPNW